VEKDAATKQKGIVSAGESAGVHQILYPPQRGAVHVPSGKVSAAKPRQNGNAEDTIPGTLRPATHGTLPFRKGRLPPGRPGPRGVGLQDPKQRGRDGPPVLPLLWAEEGMRGRQPTDLCVDRRLARGLTPGWEIDMVRNVPSPGGILFRAFEVLSLGRRPTWHCSVLAPSFVPSRHPVRTAANGV
jgi:hypothetical protein